MQAMNLAINTARKRQVIDLTDQIQAALPPAANGLVVITVLHTTAAVTTADLDPGTDLDLLDFLKAITPSAPWRHPHDPAHAPDHLLASVIGPSVALPIAKGELILGTWQRIVLIELDGPRERQLNLAVAAI
jgi:secondary thiamine-phosphate synthase enzyme